MNLLVCHRTNGSDQYRHISRQTARHNSIDCNLFYRCFSVHRRDLCDHIVAWKIRAAQHIFYSCFCRCDDRCSACPSAFIEQIADAIQRVHFKRLCFCIAADDWGLFFFGQRFGQSVDDLIQACREGRLHHPVDDFVIDNREPAHIRQPGCNKAKVRALSAGSAFLTCCQKLFMTDHDARLAQPFYISGVVCMEHTAGSHVAVCGNNAVDIFQPLLEFCIELRNIDGLCRIYFQLDAFEFCSRITFLQQISNDLQHDRGMSFEMGIQTDGLSLQGVQTRVQSDGSFIVDFCPRAVDFHSVASLLFYSFISYYFSGRSDVLTTFNFAVGQVFPASYQIPVRHYLQQIPSSGPRKDKGLPVC